MCSIRLRTCKFRAKGYRNGLLFQETNGGARPGREHLINSGKKMLADSSGSNSILLTPESDLAVGVFLSFPHRSDFTGELLLFTLCVCELIKWTKRCFVLTGCPILSVWVISRLKKYPKIACEFIRKK